MHHQIMKEVKWEAGHRLLNYKGLCAHLHGHSYRAEIHIGSNTLDPQGFVIDFVEVTKKIKTWVDDNWDHAFLYNAADPLAKWLVRHHQRRYSFKSNPTAEYIAWELYDRCVTEIESQTWVRDVFVGKVVVWETATSYAVYQE